MPDNRIASVLKILEHIRHFLEYDSFSFRVWFVHGYHLCQFDSLLKMHQSISPLMSICLNFSDSLYLENRLTLFSKSERLKIMSNPLWQCSPIRYIQWPKRKLKWIGVPTPVRDSLGKSGNPDYYMTISSLWETIYLKNCHFKLELLYVCSPKSLSKKIYGLPKIFLQSLWIKTDQLYSYSNKLGIK